MFAVIYRGSIYPEREADYQQAWKVLAHYFMSERGAIGACLHKTEQEEWIAYSRWPDLATRDAAWLTEHELPSDILAAKETLLDCIDRSKPYEEIGMQLKHDMLGV